MLSNRMRRRLVRHHLAIGVASTVALLGIAAIARSGSPFFSWSMATAYVGLVLLGLSLATGPFNVIRRLPNPVSTDLRRDLGIWAGIISCAHFLIGWQVHQKHRWQYWFRESDRGAIRPRGDLFGWANHTGLVAVLIALLLLALSNDVLLRRLGTPRWKSLQRWNYVLFVLVVFHGVAYQISEKRALAGVVVFALLSLATFAVQGAGFRAVRERSRRGAV